jgi:hypothetical protein
MFGNNFELPASTKESCNKLKTTTYIYIGLMIVRFLLGDMSVIMVDAMIVIMIFIFLGSVNAFMAAWTIFLEIMAIFSNSILLLFIIQDYLFGFIPYLLSFYFILQFTQFIIYLHLIKYSFAVYKEYKAITQNYYRNDYRI